MPQERMSIAEYKKGNVKAKGRSRGTHTPGVMNPTEVHFSQWIEIERALGNIYGWWFEEQTFKLGFDCRYTPDFFVHEVLTGHLVFYEVKASYIKKDSEKIETIMEGDSQVKIKVAAARYPMYVFRLAIRLPDGGWKFQEIKPL